MEKQKNALLRVGIALIIFFISLPLFGNTIYYQEPHDTLFHTQRIQSIAYGLQQGQFPVRIHGEMYDGYGYGVSLFYPAVFLYIPAFLHIFGLNLVTSYNIFLLLINVATLLGSYYAFRCITKSHKIGFLAAVLYTSSTYRLEDIYVRGSIGECLALIFIPICFCSLIQIKRGEEGKWVILALSFTGVLQAHILSFALVVIGAIAYVLWYLKIFMQKTNVLKLMKAVGVFILLNLGYLIPFWKAYKMPLIVKEGNENFWDTAATPIQLFDVLKLSINGSEPYRRVSTFSMPKTPGVLLLIGTIVFILLTFIVSEEKNKKMKQEAVGFTIVGLLLVWMTTTWFPWHLIEKISFLRTFFSTFQFVWRYNVIAIFCLSVSAAYGIYHLFIDSGEEEMKKMMVVIMLIICGVFVFMNRLNYNVPQLRDEEVVENGKDDELYMPQGYDLYEERLPMVVNGAATVQYGNYSMGYLNCSFDFVAEESTDWMLTVPFTYYPDYHVLLNGIDLPTEMNEAGIVQVTIPYNVTSGRIEVFYQDSLMEFLGTYISLLTGSVCIIWGVGNYVRNKVK